MGGEYILVISSKFLTAALFFISVGGISSSAGSPNSKYAAFVTESSVSFTASVASSGTYASNKNVRSVARSLSDNSSFSSSKPR